MAVATITLESSNGDSVVAPMVVSAPTDDIYVRDDFIVLDVNPEGMYDTAFRVRTQSGAFEPGGRAVGESIPIRNPILPFWLTPESRPRFQKLWGTPGDLKKVKCTWNGPSGPRFLILKLAQEIKYTTEDGFDSDIDGIMHAVVSANAYNPMYEGVETVASWENTNDRFTITVTQVNGNFTLTYGGQTTANIPFDAAPSAIKAALEALSSVGAGHVTVTGTPANVSTLTPGQYVVVFTGVTGTLTGASGVGIIKVTPASIGWFEVWNPTDQKLWLEWEFDPAKSWQFPDFAFGQERRWNRPVGADAERMIVTPELTQLLSVMSDPFMDTYVNADLSNAAGLFNGVEPIYPVPPYTGTEDDPILMPVVCNGPAGAKVTLRQRRFWSAESGLEA